MNKPQDPPGQGPGHQHGEPVTISVDGVDRTIADGVYKVSALKHQFGIPLDYELDQVVDGVFTALNDARSLHVRGGEVLVSHVRQGGSS